MLSPMPCCLHRSFVHPGFQPGAFDFDLAALVLDQPSRYPPAQVCTHALAHVRLLAEMSELGRVRCCPFAV